MSKAREPQFTSEDHRSVFSNAESSPLPEELPLWLPLVITIGGVIVVFGLAVGLLSPQSPIRELLWRDQLIHRLSQTCTLLLFWGGIGLATLKHLKQKREYRDLESIKETTAQTLRAQQDHLIGALSSTIVTYQRSLSVSPLKSLLGMYADGEADREQLLNVADRERDRCYDRTDGDYRGLNAVMWLMPLSGFLGTVIGMSLSISHFDQLLKIDPTEAKGALTSIQNLSPAIQGLSTAFDTTLLALALIIPLKLITIALERRDDHLIEGIDRYLGSGFVAQLPALQRVAPSPERVLLALTESTSQISAHLTPFTETLTYLSQDLRHLSMNSHLEKQIEMQGQLLRAQQEMISRLEILIEQNGAPLVLSRGAPRSIPEHVSERPPPSSQGGRSSIKLPRRGS